jgi:hypothetical protein
MRQVGARRGHAVAGGSPASVRRPLPRLVLHRHSVEHLTGAILLWTKEERGSALQRRAAGRRGTQAHTRTRYERPQSSKRSAGAPGFTAAGEDLFKLGVEIVCRSRMEGKLFKRHGRPIKYSVSRQPKTRITRATCEFVRSSTAEEFEY